STVEVTFDSAPRNVKVNAQDWTFEGLVENRLPNNSIKFEYVEKNKDEPLARFPATIINPFVRVERIVNLGQEWSVSTRVIRIAPETGAITVKVPLLAGEHVLTEGIQIEDNQLVVNLRPEMPEISWESKLDLATQIELTANPQNAYFESWKFIPSSYWRLQFEGIPSIADDKADVWQPEFLPFPSEKLTVGIQALKPSEGVSLTFDSANLDLTPGERLTRSQLTTTFRSTKGGEHEFVLPPESVIEKIYLDNEAVPRIDAHANPKISFAPGKHSLSVSWKNELSMQLWTQSLPVSFKQNVSNITTRWHVPADRWILFVSGGTLGPAVLFWGTFILVIVISVLLGRSKLTPVSTFSWILLGAGLSTTSLWVGIVMVLWFVLLQWRGKNSTLLAETPFNFMQLLIGFLTFIMVLSLVFSVPKSLLGVPDMGITGYGSTAMELRWYQDMTSGDLPQHWVISLPMWVYRLSMLVWALWLAFKFIDWLRWGWDQFCEGGAWRQSAAKQKKNKSDQKESSS
ncbi:MAG TPA: hypothetical protein VFM46_13770, partial [Pseudomonadales bacterium]|nr:hypothetical protein [Pseudomonadales bacterium]